jgi:hypothetical protein
VVSALPLVGQHTRIPAPASRRNGLDAEGQNGVEVWFRAPAGSLPDPVGAGNSVTSCDLGIFMDQAAEAIPALETHTGHFSG